jgi:xyloglucan-specific exo-beta-1,4-glucanase
MSRSFLSLFPRALRALPFIAPVAFASSVFAGTCVAQTPDTFMWKSVNIQGMGYVTGMVIHEKPPYTRYVRTDVGGVYRFDDGSRTWQPLGDKYARTQNEVGDIESIAVDAANVNRVWKAAPLGRELQPDGSTVKYLAEVHVSDDLGSTWRPTGLAAQKIAMDGNGDFRGMAGERLLVDPFNAERVYYASRRDGLWLRNANVWQKIGGGLPATTADPGITFVIADRAAGAQNGAAKTLYAGVYASGVWRSTDAGTTWQQVAGSPNAYPLRAAVAPDGTVFVTFGGNEGGTFNNTKVDGGAWRLKNGVWKNMLPAETNTFSGVTIHPGNANKIAIGRGSGREIFLSEDGGEQWRKVTKTDVQSEPAYYPKPRPSNYNARVGEWGNAALVFDPAASDRVWHTNGFGVVMSENISAASPRWDWVMGNLEELVVRGVKVPPLATLPGTSERGADLLSVVADMIGFRHASVDQVPAATLGPIDYVAGATSVDYAGQKPEFAAFVGWDQDKGGWWAVRSGFSSDNGKTFTPFENMSPGSGGVIAMSATNPDNMVWAPTRWAIPQVTFDRGRTWTKAKKTDGTDLPASFKLSNEWWHAQILVADRIDGNRFYYFDSSRFYTSTDGGRTWQASSQNLGARVPPFWTLSTNIVVNPVASGQLWMTFAPNTNQFETFKMFRSDDFGMTFRAIDTAAQVNFMAFGKGDAADRPYMFIHGRVGAASKDGIYRSKDLGQTWELVSKPDENQFGKISSMAADMRTKNRVVIGTGGRGIFVGDAASVPQGYTLAVNAGGGAAANYAADAGATGGGAFATTRAIDVGGVAQPAPEAVYQSGRFGNAINYRSPVLAEGRRYLVRLHFAEVWWGVDGLGGVTNGAGMRRFDVSINGNRVLANFDVFAAAGGANKAVVREFEAYSDGTGTIRLDFNGVAGAPDTNAKISGIEFIELGF